MSNNSGYKTYYHIHDPKNGGYKTYYHGIDVTGLDYDIVSRMYVSDNDFCTSKIFDTIVRLNRCKQENPKTARLVDDLIKELVSILDLHVEEEKKKKSSLDKQIAELKEENEKLRKIIEYLQKKKNVVYTRKSCSNCLYGGIPRYRLPCSCCDENYNRWISAERLLKQQLENLMNNTPEPNMGIHKDSRELNPRSWVSALKKEYENSLIQSTTESHLKQQKNIYIDAAGQIVRDQKPNANAIRQQLKNLMNNTPEPKMGIYKY